MPRQPKIDNNETFGFSEFVRGLGEKLTLQSSRPNLLAYKPHDKQTAFHSSQKRNRLYIGGNRSGKTTGGIVEDLMWCRGIHPYREIPIGGVRGRIVAVDFIHGIEQIIIPELKRWCPMSDLRGGSWDSAFSTQERILHFANGSFIELMSYEQDVDKFAGTSRHFVHFDEEPPQDIYIECIARLVDTAGSWWMTLTPVMGMQWMYDDIYMPGKNGTNPMIDVIEVEMWENPYLATTEVQNFLASLPEEDRAARVKGNFTRRGGVILKHYDRKIHVIDQNNFTLPLDMGELYASLDHGYNNPTAWLWHWVDPDGNVVTFAEHYETEMTVDDHAEQVLLMEQRMRRVPTIRVGDPSIAQRNAITGDSIQAQYLIHGVSVMLGNNDVISGLNKMNAYMKPGPSGRPRWYITDNCEHLLEEIPKYRWKTWHNKKSERENNPYDVPHKKNDHAVDSCRYFFGLMPDLTPSRIATPVAEQKLPISSDNLVAVAQQPIYDTNLRKKKVNGEWNIQSGSDYMGNEW
jgi:phage terminase large subunit-like protein